MVARLVPVSGGPPILLDKPIILIGRHPDCDAIIQTSPKISRRHCCIAQVNDEYQIRDLGSMNGISVNGKRLTESRLRPGDHVSLGDVAMVFTDDDAFPALSNSTRTRKALPAGAANGQAPLRAIPLPQLPPSPLPPEELSLDLPVMLPEHELPPLRARPLSLRPDPPPRPQNGHSD